MGWHLALYTFGVFRMPANDPANDGFYARNDPVLATVDRAPGLVARSGYAGEGGPRSWGPQVFPDFYVERGDGWAPSTLSLWEGVEAAMAFSYSGLHAEALSHGREWFVTPEWPPLACWWVAKGTRPNWAEAVRRHRHLHDHGPTAEAFTFKDPFDPAGHLTTPDSARLRYFRQNQHNLPT